jgi:hypothetical protein
MAVPRRSSRRSQRLQTKYLSSSRNDSISTKEMAESCAKASYQTACDRGQISQHVPVPPPENDPGRLLGRHAVSLAVSVDSAKKNIIATLPVLLPYSWVIIDEPFGSFSSIWSFGSFTALSVQLAAPQQTPAVHESSA